jgi:hypothetical protein
LLDYLEEHADFLVCALLPEDAESIGGEHERITEI